MNFIPYSWSIPPPPPEKNGKIAKNRENWVNSL